MEATTIFLCVLLLTVLLFLTVFLYVIYSGLLDSVQVGAGKPPIKNVEVAYKFGRGPYKDTGSVFTEVTSIAPKLRCLGIYYDDPNQVPAHKLRWAVGAVLSEGAGTPDPAVVSLFESKGFQNFHLPEVSNVVRASFPDRTSLSVLIGIFKVYPLLGEYVRVNKLCAHPWMEVYDGRTISYLAPLAHQDEFYVPESLEQSEPEEEPEEVLEVRHTVIKEALEAVPEVWDEILLGKRIPFPGEREPSSSQSTEANVNGEGVKVAKSSDLGAMKNAAVEFGKRTERGDDSREVSRGSRASGKHSSREDSGVSGCDRRSMNSIDTTNIFNPSIRKAPGVVTPTHRPSPRDVNRHSKDPSTDGAQTGDEGDVSQNSSLSDTPASPLSTVLSDCSVTDSDRERSASASFYSSQDELSQSSQNWSSQSELSQSDVSQSDVSQSGFSQSDMSRSGVSHSSVSFSSRAATTEFSSDSEVDTETETSALPQRNTGRVS